MNNENNLVNLFSLLRKGERKNFLTLIKLKPELINSKGSNFESPFLYLVTENEINLVVELLKLGAKVNDTNTFGDSALHITTNLNYFQLTKILIENGANIDYCNLKSCKTPLINAIEQKSIELLNLLLDFKVNVNNYCLKSPSLFFFDNDSVIEYLDVLDYFIKKGKPDLNLTDENGDTVLHIAIMSNNIKFAELLIKNGASQKVKNNRGMTPIDLMDEFDYEGDRNFI